MTIRPSLSTLCLSLGFLLCLLPLKTHPRAVFGYGYVLGITMGGALVSTFHECRPKK